MHTVVLLRIVCNILVIILYFTLIATGLFVCMLSIITEATVKTSDMMYVTDAIYNLINHFIDIDDLFLFFICFTSKVHSCTNNFVHEDNALMRIQTILFIFHKLTTAPWLW